LAGQVRVEVAKGVDITHLHDPVEPGALLGQEVCMLPVLAWVRQIDLPVRSIYIPAEKHPSARQP